MKRKILFIFIQIFIITSYWHCNSSSDPDPTNNPPVISSITANPDSVQVNGTCKLSCNANDPDGNNINYTWESSAGSINESGANATWTAPGSVGTYSISCRVDDGNGGQDIESKNIKTILLNSAPVISSLNADPDTIYIGETSTLTCEANDTDSDALTYNWIVSEGTINGTGETVTWSSPDITGVFLITCIVDDGKGEADSSSLSITVEEIPIPTEGLVAYWPFNGNANDESGNSNNGTVHGAVLTTDRFGNENCAYYFNGNANYITTNVTPNSIFTLSIWYNKNQNQNDNAGLFSTYSGSSNYSGAYYAVNDTYDWIRCDGNSLDSFYSVSQTWKHIVVVSDGTKVKVYENTQKKLDINGTTNHSNTFAIGNSRYNGRYFSGKIDDIRIYNRILTENEIALLYQE